jgi:hypothetical protein
MSDYGQDDRGSIPDRESGEWIFILASGFRRALEPTQAPV